MTSVSEEFIYMFSSRSAHPVSIGLLLAGGLLLSIGATQAFADQPAVGIIRRSPEPYTGYNGDLSAATWRNYSPPCGRGRRGSAALRTPATSVCGKSRQGRGLSRPWRDRAGFPDGPGDQCGLSSQQAFGECGDDVFIADTNNHRHPELPPARA
jgi:hypothetical protein